MRVRGRYDTKNKYKYTEKHRDTPSGSRRSTCGQDTLLHILYPSFQLVSPLSPLLLIHHLAQIKILIMQFPLRGDKSIAWTNTKSFHLQHVIKSLARIPLDKWLWSLAIVVIRAPSTSPHTTIISFGTNNLGTIPNRPQWHWHITNVIHGYCTEEKGGMPPPLPSMKNDGDGERERQEE